MRINRFIEMYRMPQNLALELLEELKKFMPIHKRSDAIPTHIQVASRK